MINPMDVNGRAIIGIEREDGRIDHSADIERLNQLLAPQHLQVADVVDGLSVVTFRIRLNLDSNLHKIQKLNYGIALDSNAVNVHIDGATLCIEKPQEKRRVIRMGNLYTPQFTEDAREGLVMMIGRDSMGGNVYYDLAKAPHMLVAGTTGSGKSVLLHQMICSLLMNHDLDVDFTLIDPKGSEFSSYRGLLNARIIDGTERAIESLYGMCREMDHRYQVLSDAGVRDISSYIGEMRRQVIVIDEFADLILTGGKRVETAVVRLAQKARACGIHLIIATQYPKREVLTGLIKANIPTRIALTTPDGTQSKVAIDRAGAEKLTGKGDMLFLPNGSIEPIRAQGCLVDEQEISDIFKECLMNQCRNLPKEDPWPAEEDATTEDALENTAQTTPEPEISPMDGGAAQDIEQVQEDAQDDGQGQEPTQDDDQAQEPAQDDDQAQEPARPEQEPEGEPKFDFKEYLKNLFEKP